MLFFNSIKRYFQRPPQGDPSLVKEVSTLPKTLPPDLKFELCSTSIFGRRYESIKIEQDNVFSTKGNRDTVQENHFKLNTSELNNLFLILKENKFDKIKIIKDITLDSPTHYIKVSWGNSFISKGESQTEYIHKKWDEVYMNCKDELINILRQTLKNQRKQVKVVVDRSLTNESNDLYISCSDILSPYYYHNNMPSYLWENDSSLQNRGAYPDDIILLPGYSELMIEWRKNGTGDTHKQKIEFPKTECSSVSLAIHLENDQLKCRIEMV